MASFALKSNLTYLLITCKRISGFDFNCDASATPNIYVVNLVAFSYLKNLNDINHPYFLSLSKYGKLSIISISA